MNRQLLTGQRQRNRWQAQSYPFRTPEQWLFHRLASSEGYSSCKLHCSSLRLRFQSHQCGANSQSHVRIPTHQQAPLTPWLAIESLSTYLQKEAHSFAEVFHVLRRELGERLDLGRSARAQAQFSQSQPHVGTPYISNYSNKFFWCFALLLGRTWWTSLWIARGAKFAHQSEGGDSCCSSYQARCNSKLSLIVKHYFSIDLYLINDSSWQAIWGSWGFGVLGLVVGAKKKN